MPSAAVGETTAGVAVEAAVAATPGPGGGPGSGPGKSPARADHHVAGLGVPSARRLGGGRGESASVPSAAKSEAATVPSAAVGETTAGVAVVAAVAATPGPGGGPGSGPGKSPARADHHGTGLGVPSARCLGGGR